MLEYGILNCNCEFKIPEGFFIVAAQFAYIVTVVGYLGRIQFL